MTKPNTELEKCLASEYFNGADPELAAMTLRAKRLLRQFNDTDYADYESKQAICRQMFGSMGEQVYIDIDFHCEYGRNIHIGDRVIINMNCTFVDNNEIRIGNDVLIASDVKIYTATHHTDPQRRLMPDWRPGLSLCNTYALPITVEDNVWIGGGAILLPGVTIGHGSVVGAGSVVTRDVPPCCVAVGNPCRVIRRNIAQE